MFEYKNINDFICKTLVGKALVKVGDKDVRETIARAYHDPDTNCIVVEVGENGVHYVYNDSLVIVDKLFEIDWDNYLIGEKPDFGYKSCWTRSSDENEPNLGDLFTTEEFYEHVQNGLFIDSDGSGYPSNGTHHLYVGAGVRDLAACKYSNTVSHIIWYNK